MVVPEPGPTGGEEGAPLAPTLERLRAPVIGSHVGPEHKNVFVILKAIVADPGPYVFGPPGSRSIFQRYGTDLAPDTSIQAKIVRKFSIPAVL